MILISVPSKARDTSIGIDANFRNLNDTQTAVGDRVPLKIDGLRTQGAFNNFGFDIWDAENSRIKPSKLRQKYDGRLIIEATPTVGGSLLTLELDTSAEGSANPIKIFEKTISLFKLEKTTITETFLFFASQNFLNNGGKLWVQCTSPVALTNASLYVRFAGGEL